MTYRGCVRNGVVIIDDGVTLPEGTIVTIQAPVTSTAEGGEDSLYRLSELAMNTGISDLASNIDYYLYGHPKATDGQP
jgi:hypothetical protein